MLPVIRHLASDFVPIAPDKLGDLVSKGKKSVW
jgi:hypothetical protein